MRWMIVTAALVPLCALYISFTHGNRLALAVQEALALFTADASRTSTQTVVENADSAASWNILEHLGGNSPWIPKTRGIVDTSIDPPGECYIDQVHMLSRHAERYPTVSAGKEMLKLYNRIHDTNTTLHGALAFANTWPFFTDSPNTHFERLVSTGAYAGTLTAFSTGVKLRTRYSRLLAHAAASNILTSFWASGSNRVIDSARYFANGFFGIDWKDLATLHIIPETPERGANTLTPGRTCAKYREDQGRDGEADENGNGNQYGHAYGYRKMRAFRRTYEPDIVNRLAQENPNFVFTEDEVFAMQQMCGFDTIARGSVSPWCMVFTPEETESFEYARDVLHYYRTGPGNPYGGAMGWLWLNATAELLEQGLAAGPLFLSFVHDGDIIPMLSALDLFPQDPHLPVDRILPDRTWRTSDVVPMAGRIILERLVCPEPRNCWSNEPFYPNHVYCDPQTYNISVRVNVNDGIVAIPGCDDGPGSSCPLKNFTARVASRGEEVGDFRTLCGLADDAPERISFLHQ